MVSEATPTRQYTLGARGASTADTRQRILIATFELASENGRVELVLADVAQRSAVSVQTILRHFGSKEGLFLAVMEFAGAAIEEERATPPGDVVRAVQTIVAHYERRGDAVFRWLVQELSSEAAALVTTQGRVVHRRWVEEAFAPQLSPVGADEREERVDLLVVATDLYTWKLLRRDRGLDAAIVDHRILALVNLILDN